MAQVSVIVPVYNAGNKLNKCIKSILTQTFTDLELILVNDGSTDHSLRICEKYLTTDPRVRIIDKSNEGSVKTRHRGVQESTTDYVMFVDADDWIHKYTVEKLYGLLRTYSADITMCNYYKVLGFIREKRKISLFEKSKMYDRKDVMSVILPILLYGQFNNSVWGKLYRRQLLIDNTNYLQNIRFWGDDMFYNLEAFQKIDKLVILNEPLYYYRHGGLTNKYMPHFFDDIINGYAIQQQVIEKLFMEQKDRHYIEINTYLLNLFNAAIYNLLNSNMSEEQIKLTIRTYTNNDKIRESLLYEETRRRFPVAFISAIKNNNVDYLYASNKQRMRKNRIRKLILNTLSKIDSPL